jgi:cytochrome c peroxidase
MRLRLNNILNHIRHISTTKFLILTSPKYVLFLRSKKNLGVLMCLMWFNFSCQNDNSATEFILKKPAHFPEFVSPDDNQLTANRVELGKILFYETALSVDSSISCATCHLQQLGFTDGKPKSVGVQNRVGMRNAPALINLAYNEFFFRDGGVTSLETQAMSPINNELEMDFDIHLAAARLAESEFYQQLAMESYGREMSAFVVVRALAAFQRTLISGNSPFDAYFYGNDETALNESQKNGKAIFFGKGNCFNCHNGFNLTNFGFENNGLYENYADKGRSRITLQAEDQGKFKVPTLRNVEKTAPYMHDGSLPTLAAVIEHYNNGGKNHVNQSNFVQPLNLTEQEKADLVNFLHALTDEEFLNNPSFQK